MNSRKLSVKVKFFCQDNFFQSKHISSVFFLPLSSKLSSTLSVTSLTFPACKQCEKTYIPFLTCCVPPSPTWLHNQCLPSMYFHMPAEINTFVSTDRSCSFFFTRSYLYFTLLSCNFSCWVQVSATTPCATMAASAGEATTRPAPVPRVSKVHNASMVSVLKFHLYTSLYCQKSNTDPGLTWTRLSKAHSSISLYSGALVTFFSKKILRVHISGVCE